MEQNRELKSVIFMFDQSFGSLRLSMDEEDPSILGINLLSSSVITIQQLNEHDVRSVLLVPGNLSNESIIRLKQYLPLISEIFSTEESFPKTLANCTEFLSTSPEHTVFCSADRLLRGDALGLGYYAIPHPAIVSLIFSRKSLKFVRVTGDLEKFERISETVPYFWECNNDGTWSLLAVMSTVAIAELSARNLQVDTFPLNISTEDPLFVQLDPTYRYARKGIRDHKILFSNDRRMLIALGPSDANDSVPIQGSHGQFYFLAPSPSLLKATTGSSIAYQRARIEIGYWSLKDTEIARIHRKLDISEFILSPCPVTSSKFQSDVDRYSGVTSLDGSGPIASRHISHPDNSRVVQALQNDLNDMGYCAYTYSFSHAGMALENVIADLTGTGYFEITPNIGERVREIILEHPLPDPPEPWLKPIIRILGDKWIESQALDSLTPIEIRTKIETIVGLKPWYPWWLRLCLHPGLGGGIIIIGCHLDSTAANDAGYNPFTDPAPGADDDGSGIAATLAIARYLSGFSGRFPHTIRFCFFNAEEQGFVGSKAYAAAMKDADAPIKAVICLDMVGYNSDDARIFEIHAGYTDPSVRDISVPIAETISTWSSCLGALAPAQIYKGTIGIAGADRNIYDGAINRSDHAAFHQQGYPAVVVTEDFFANLSTEPGADPNPNYHEGDDTIVDSAYAADITCAVAFAVKDIANG